MLAQHGLDRGLSSINILRLLSDHKAEPSASTVSCDGWTACSIDHIVSPGAAPVLA
jgi:hypothetical protein